jgi:hypothetical protein
MLHLKRLLLSNTHLAYIRLGRSLRTQPPTPQLQTSTDTTHIENVQPTTHADQNSVPHLPQHSFHFRPSWLYLPNMSANMQTYTVLLRYVARADSSVFGRCAIGYFVA